MKGLRVGPTATCARLGCRLGVDQECWKMEWTGPVGQVLVYGGAFLAAVLFIAVAVHRRRRRRSVEGEFLEHIVEPACSCLAQNLEMLRRGDVGWRQLARGRSSVR